MQENPILITEITKIASDQLQPGKPYIPKVPRPVHAIAYITEGGLRYLQGGHSVELSVHEIIFIHSGNVDFAECVGSVPVSYITIDFNTLNGDFTLPNRFSPGEKFGHLFETFSRALDIYRRRSNGWQMECIELVYHILNELRQPDDETAYKFRRIAPMLSMLDEYISDPSLSAAGLAAACGMSTGSLNRIIHVLYGCSTSKLIFQRRMEHACSLLRSSTYSIADISVRCGYSDIYAFSHAFSRAFGVPPTGWRG